ncbi:MAG TPA: hypothetical protein VKY27_02685 [Bacteriovoracaceae bacterium]|nr:hypothetical protein [Bacteriovoracaceae bacterium]
MKFIFIFLFFYLAQPAEAKDIKHPQFNFQISTHKLKSTDLHYSFVSVGQEAFQKEAGVFSALANPSREKDPHKTNSKYVLFRAVFPIKKAVGHFDSEKFSDAQFIKALEGGDKVKKIRDNAFITQVSTPVKYQYFSKFHFDADDLSSLPDSRIGRKIMDLKSSDPLLLSANVSIFREMFGFTQLLKESSEFYAFVALDETTTLVVFVKLAIFSSDDMFNYVIERDLIKKIKKIQKALEKS